MKLNVICRWGSQPEDKMLLKVPVGEGQQTLKWLSLAVAAQYALHKAHGRYRAREDNIAPPGFFLPLKVFSSSVSQDLTPDMIINEVFADEDEVEVVLQQQVQVDDVGAPEMSDWAREAFFDSECFRKREENARIREQSAARLADLRDGLKASDDAGIDRRVSVEMKVLVTGCVETPAEIRAAIMCDWPALRIGELGLSGTTQNGIREELQAKFTAINESFMYYSGAPRFGGDKAGLKLTEFAHLLHRAGVFDKERERNLIVKLFTDAAAEKGDSSAVDIRTASLSRAEFICSLLRAAVMQKEQRGRAARDRVLESFKSILSDIEHVYVLTSEDHVGHSIREKLHSIMDNNRKALGAVFRRRVDAANDADSYPDVMSFTTFKRLLLERGVLALKSRRPPGHGKQVQALPYLTTDLFGQDLLSFIDPQAEAAMLTALRPMEREAGDCQYTGFTFTEFIEASGRVAAEAPKLTGLPADSPAEEKIRLCMAAFMDG